MVKAAESEEWSYLTLLDRLLDEEVVCKEQKRIATVLRISGLPYVKTIDEFDFAFQPNLDRRAVMNLFDMTFLERKENIILLGPPGVGKTHLAASLAVNAAQCGHMIHFVTMSELIRRLKADRQSGNIGKDRRPYQ